MAAAAFSSSSSSIWSRQNQQFQIHLKNKFLCFSNHFN
jgi:hypothetical protein